MRRIRAVRVARAVLLVALALGVCGMHTLGHLDGRHGGPFAGAHAMEVFTPTPHQAELPAFGPDHGMPGFDPTDVCLAVLMSIIVLLLSAARIRAVRGAGAGGGALSSVRLVARPPPKLTSRRLAILSMLRI
ncbi:hypothetical protein ACBJ59_52885 [Nonomuraea sp. MTCD27]|uniref:hypothetical protein n=1 Tax=Nonomuraea sp. MTCD27 TaxID=1676747 RepID=UPI0035C14F12